MNRSAFATVAVAAALAAAFFTGSSVARSTSSTPDNKIATVNIQALFEKLTERSDRFNQLQAEAAGLEQKFGTINAQINQERDAANKLPDGPAKDAALDAVVDKDVQAQIEIKKAKAKLEKAQADTIRALFGKIQAEAQKQAVLAGFSMVMVADDWVNISPRATAQEATQVMSLRRFLYIDNKQHDVTDQVLKALNDAYAAAKPSTAAPSAPAPGAPGTPAPAPAPR